MDSDKRDLIKVYVFDIFGEFLDCGSIKEISEKYGIGGGTIRAAIRRKSLYQKRYYFQDNKGFRKPKKKIRINPLDFEPQGEKIEKKGRAKYSYDDKIAIVNKLYSDYKLAEIYNITEDRVRQYRANFKKEIHG